MDTILLLSIEAMASLTPNPLTNDGGLTMKLALDTKMFITTTTLR